MLTSPNVRMSPIFDSAEGSMLLCIPDAYYASGKFIHQLLANGHQLLTRAKSNAVAYLPVPTPELRRRGRPRIYGEKVRLKELAQDDAAFTSAPSPVYGENNVTLRYRWLDLIWRPAARLVRFVIVCQQAGLSIDVFPVGRVTPQLAPALCMQENHNKQWRTDGLRLTRNQA